MRTTTKDGLWLASAGLLTAAVAAAMAGDFSGPERASILACLGLGLALALAGAAKVILGRRAR